MEAVIWGFLGTLVGASTSILTTYLSNSNAVKLHDNSLKLERLEKSKSFQRETILELQEALHDAIRLITEAHYEDIKAHNNGSTWGKSPLPDQLEESIRIANRRVMLYVERVADDTARKMIKELMEEANSVTFADSKDESSKILDQITLKTIAVIEETGRVLRSLY